MTSSDYCTQIVTDLAAVDADEWNGMLSHDADANALLRHEFLDALHTSGCAAAATGWAPRYLTVRCGTTLVAAAPLYDKQHSYGEYVFDWAWADAAQRHGIRYYPKLLSAVPFSPVPGARLIAIDAAARAQLADAVVAYAAGARRSSLHVLFAPPTQIALLAERGAIVRTGVQFHWRNRGYRDIDDFLDQLTQPKRKKIRAERRKVASAGVTLTRLTGHTAAARDWSFFYRCYATTYARHGSAPYLSLAFFRTLAARMPDNLLLVLAHRAGQPVAAAFGIFDERRLYGRYWGAIESIDCLHFECCYYQMIEFAIERGIGVFEGGAQGAHKIARGLDPVPTYSAHWLTDPGLHDAVARFVARETDAVAHTIEELDEHRAFRRTAADGSAAATAVGADD